MVEHMPGELKVWFEDTRAQFYKNKLSAIYANYVLEGFSRPFQSRLMFASTARARLLKHLSGAPLKSRLLIIPAKRLGWKDLPGTNAPAYNEH